MASWRIASGNGETTITQGTPLTYEITLQGAPPDTVKVQRGGPGGDEYTIYGHQPFFIASDGKRIQILGANGQQGVYDAIPSPPVIARRPWSIRSGNLRTTLTGGDQFIYRIYLTGPYTPQVTIEHFTTGPSNENTPLFGDSWVDIASNGRSINIQAQNPDQQGEFAVLLDQPTVVSSIDRAP